MGKSEAVRKDGPPLEAPHAERDPFSYLENYLQTIGDQVSVARGVASALIGECLLSARGGGAIEEIARWVAQARARLNEDRARWRDRPTEERPPDPHVASRPLPPAPDADESGYTSPNAVRVARAVGGTRILKPNSKYDVRIVILVARSAGGGDCELSHTRGGSWLCSCAPFRRNRTCEHVEGALFALSGCAASS